MRFYNKWHLEIKWWLQEEGIWDWLIEHKLDIFAVVSLIIMLCITVLSYLAFMNYE